jgi:hypothetical protein
MANQFGFGHLVANQSMAASFTSKIVPIDFNSGISVEIATTDTAALNGTLAIEVSNSGANWAPLTLSGGGLSIAIVANGINFEDLDVTARFLRLAWTSVAGVGTMNAYVHVKRI